MFCGKCGKKLSDSETFCGECGTPVGKGKTEQVQQQSSAPTKEAVYQKEPPEKKGILLIILIILALAVVILVGVIVYMLNQGTQSPQTEQALTEVQPQQSEISPLPKIEASETPEEEKQIQPTEPPVESAEAAEEEEYSEPIFEMTSASNVTVAKKSRNYSPYLAQDGQPDTAWSVTGTSNEWIMLSSETEQYVSGIQILNGYTKYSSEYGWVYYKNNRPKDITISFSDGTSINTTLKDVFDESNYHYQTIALDTIIKTKFVKITIDSVYDGDTWNDTCISELLVY